MNEADVPAYLELRRQEVADARRRAVQQPGEWAADGAMHELDRLEGWLNLRRQQERAEALVREADAAWRRCHAAIMGQEAAGSSRRWPAAQLEAER